MRKRTGSLLLFVMLIASCEPVSDKEKHPMTQDPHSYATPTLARVKHLHWKANVDFESRTIQAVAVWDIETKEGATSIIFDTKDLSIEKVWTDDQEEAQFQIGAKDEILGQALTVVIQPGTKQVGVQYKTSPDAEALQWLEPQQTAGKKHPFLFTQSQAILARSWVPCQDSPSIRFTYNAEVTCPKELLVLMSASNPQEKNAVGTYTFQMSQPIPSYLFAMAIGDLSFENISERSGVYAEPSMLEKSVWEFADLEKMIVGAEELYGAYQWERYDVLVLPPSFPFGGMENPRLTFATPTILAGDRSLTSLIAHELAHSWSGNLVTNATWNDFWLNEGFTVYFEHRIMEKLYGKDYAEMLALLALQDLEETIEDLKRDNQYGDTKLRLSLEGRNPDDGVTDIAYNKGYFFLRSFEEKFGRDKFDQFLNAYFSGNSFRSLNTDNFIHFIKSFYREKFAITLSDHFFTAWIFSEGLPAESPRPVSERLSKVDEVLVQWKREVYLDTESLKNWSTHEWVHFLKNLPPSLSYSQMENLDQVGQFTQSGNAEIVTLWLVQAVRNQYKPADSKLETFLINTGRRKFLSPIYHELVKSPEGKEKAKEIYQKARTNYHFVATNTLDKLLQ